MKWWSAVITGTVLLALCVPVFAQEEDAEEEKKTGFERFALVLQRNIFDPERRPPPTPEQRRREAPRPTVHRIALIGVYIDEAQRVALFGGSSREYNVTLATGESIAGFEVASITTDNITLRKEEREIELRIGASLQRQEDEDWVLSNEAAAAPAVYTSKTGSSSTVTTPAPGGTDAARQEMLRKLMERRKQEVGR